MRIGILEGRWNSITNQSRLGAKYAPFVVALGVPAEWQKIVGSQPWGVFDDGRLTPEDLAYLAAIIANPSLVTVSLALPTTEAEALLNHAEMRGIRGPGVDLVSWLPADPEDDVILADVIAAQGPAAVGFVKAGPEVDAELRPA